MKVLPWPRRSGKTTILLYMLRESDDLYLIVADYRRKQHILRLLKSNPILSDIDPSRIVTVNDARQYILGRDARVVIDDLEACLMGLLSRQVTAISLNSEDTDILWPISEMGKDE